MAAIRTKYRIVSRYDTVTNCRPVFVIQKKNWFGIYRDMDYGISINVKECIELCEKLNNKQIKEYD